MDGSPGATFRRELSDPDPTIALGAYDALSAKIVEQSGGSVVYMSGSSVSTSVHGEPDVGLTTMTEMVRRGRQMAGAVDLPVFCDADTGYGNSVNVRRTVEEFERAGVAGVHLEDQTFPKECGHFGESSVVPRDRMIQKIRAAVDAREDEAFVVIARTDARQTDGLEAAIERAQTYRDAGADILFVEAPMDRTELETIADRVDAPLLANMTEGGKTPMVPAEELGDMGYDVVLFPATGFKRVCRALQDLYADILETGTQRHRMDDLVSWEERNAITGLDAIREWERRYATDSTDD